MVTTPSFFEQPDVRLIEIPVAHGVPQGIQAAYNPSVGIGGAYGTWGYGYDNAALRGLVERRMGEPLSEEDVLNLAPLGFTSRHHTPEMTQEEHLELELTAGANFLREAALICGWDPGEVEGVLIGTSAPPVEDFTTQIAARAGIPDSALKVSVHKACDGSVSALHLALNPELGIQDNRGNNIAQRLYGKKTLVGGIEGLSRLVEYSRDTNALQLFANGAGVIGVIPGETMRFMVGKTHEVYDEQGVLAVRMYYPHSDQLLEDQSNVEVSLAGHNHIRVAGLMNEPTDGRPVVMAGMMGMVKLFVRTGVQAVRDAYHAYQALLSKIGRPEKTISVAIVHHANLKINRLKDKRLRKEGIHLPMPWLLSEFGNISAASNMIAFLRQLPRMQPGDHVLVDGFGAGTYYDVLVVELGG